MLVRVDESQMLIELTSQYVEIMVGIGLVERDIDGETTRAKDFAAFVVWDFELHV